MNALFVGDGSVFAIESCVDRCFNKPSLKALGYFVIHVGGRVYGVQRQDATLLACSFDAVRERIAKRGLHKMDLVSIAPAAEIVEAVVHVRYSVCDERGDYWGRTSEEFGNELLDRDIVWAPDGDAAFDDGGHVLQFDVGPRVRLVAFGNESSFEERRRTMREEWIDSDAFYAILTEWYARFEDEWMNSSKE